MTLTNDSCAAAAAVTGKSTGKRWRPATFALGAAALMMAGCSLPAKPAAEGVAQVFPAADAPSSAPKPPREALPLDAAVARLTVALFDRAQLGGPGLAARRMLVIDPLIDHETGSELAATRSMEEQIKAVVGRRYPQIEPRPFTAASLDERPLVLAGSITTVDGPGTVPTSIGGPPRTYRIWAVLADLQSGRIVSHETAWVQVDTVNATPTRFFRDSPAWLADASMVAYLKTCDAKVGDLIAPAYLAGLKTEAAVSDGVRAYDSGRYEAALVAYKEAQRLPQGVQLRVYNGVYLTNQALGRRRQAEQAFGQLVDYGLGQGKLAMKLVFRANSTAFWPDPVISGSYPMWLLQIARRTAAREACLRIVGHTSPTGPDNVNQPLSEARARAVRSRLVLNSPPLGSRTEVRGAGSSEPLVGTGKDDATDVLDRRVEFDPVSCSTELHAEAAPLR